MINHSINTFFSDNECDSILKFCIENGESFSYSNTDTWDCKRIYNDDFKIALLEKISTLYKNDKITFWFDYSNFNVKNINVSLTQYYDGRFLNLHLDSTSNYTTIIPLTDGYIDGRFVLSEVNHIDINDSELKLELNKGEGVTFEGNKVFHGVMPVTNGLRASLNIWMNDTDFNYYKLDKTNKLI